MVACDISIPYRLLFNSRMPHFQSSSLLSSRGKAREKGTTTWASSTCVTNLDETPSSWLQPARSEEEELVLHPGSLKWNVGIPSGSLTCCTTKPHLPQFYLYIPDLLLTEVFSHFAFFWPRWGIEWTIMGDGMFYLLSFRLFGQSPFVSFELKMIWGGRVKESSVVVYRWSCNCSTRIPYGHRFIYQLLQV